ncbi:G2/mitotic-specific cyclin-B3 [Pipistrellus kuhlii]|uniref:Cyclin B3 n=1 Tax=Pipistrellus kuhlii TaxID=59472 RepID=A0A7J7T1K0_PIPKU|nr:G2/mitotic-specific cyclin-B3 [Pipistrellus kuhlii]KAF6294559.1 cyclin B3 [Pipistrellus kuhlii]
MTPPLGSDEHETKKLQSNKIVPRDDDESEKSEEEYQAVISPSSPQGLLKMRSAFDDLTNASQSPPDQPKKEANKKVVKGSSKKINKNTPALQLAKNNEINIKKYDLEPSTSAANTTILNSVEESLTVNVSTISKAPTTEEASLSKKPLVLKEKPTTRDTIHMKRSLSLKKDVNWNKTSGFVEPQSLLEETESDFKFVSEPVTFGNKHETEEATFPKRTLPSSKLYVKQGKQFYCVNELISLDTNIEKDSIMEPMNFRKKPKTEESTTTERLLTLNKCTAQDKVSYKRKSLISQKATSREELLNKEPFPFENKSASKELCCVKELTSLDTNIEKDSIMEPMNFRKKPKTEESTTTERLLTLNKCTAHEKVSYKRKSLISQKATSREELPNKEPFPFENKSATKEFLFQESFKEKHTTEGDISVVKKPLTLQKNPTEEESLLKEPLIFKKKHTIEEETPKEELVFVKRCTTKDKPSCLKKSLVQTISEEKSLVKEPLSFKKKPTTEEEFLFKESSVLPEKHTQGEVALLKKPWALQENIHSKDEFLMEPVSFRKKYTTNEAISSKEPLALKKKKYTTQIKMSICQEVLDLQNMIGKDKDFSVKKPGPFRKKSSTEEAIDTKTPLSLKKKHIIDTKEDSSKKLLTLQEKSTTDEDFLLKKPSILKKKLSTDAIISTDSKLSLEKSTAQGEVFLLKKQSSLQQKPSIERESPITEELTFQRKLAINDSFNLKKSSSRKKVTFKEPLALQDNPTEKEDTILKDVSILPVNTSSQMFTSPPESRRAKSLSDILFIVNKYHTSQKHSARKSSSKKRVSDWRRVAKKEITILEIIDEAHYDPFFNLSYTQDIFKYMKEREEKFRLKNYMSNQSDINIETRALLVNWMVKMQINCDLNHESLYLAVKLVDRYLMKKIFKKEKMQLLGAAALLIAAKLEETRPPKLEKFLKSRKEIYQRHEILAMEMSILRTLEFEINIPVAYQYLRMYSMNIHVDIKTVVLSRFICELTLHEYDYIQEKGSELAAASFFLALYMTKLKSVAHLLDYHFGYKPSDVSLLIRKLNKLLSLYPYHDRFKAVCFKYSHKNFYEVTQIPILNKLKLEEILSSR